jgi:diguanylate cyclase (GGDEF)-like protein
MSMRKDPMLKRFRHYLTDPEVFEQNQDTVNEINTRSMQVYLFLGTLIAIIYFILELTLRHKRDIIMSLLPLLYFAVVFPVCYDRNKKHPEQATKLLYFLEAPLLLLAIYYGTFQFYDEAAFTFYPLILGLPLVILDRPRNLFGYVGGMYVLFLFIAGFTKTRDAFLNDVVHTCVCSCLTFSLDAFVLSSRIELLETSMNFLHDSEHDPLTGIYNRRGTERIRGFLANGVAGMFLEIDVDHFKELNDQYGHETGDLVLEKISGVLMSSFRSSDVIMRNGGDEFVVYAPGLISSSQADLKLNHIWDEAHKLSTENVPAGTITISGGCVLNHSSYSDFEELFRKGDEMLYEAKRNSRDSWAISDADPIP